MGRRYISTLMDYATRYPKPCPPQARTPSLQFLVDNAPRVSTLTMVGTQVRSLQQSASLDPHNLALLGLRQWCRKNRWKGVLESIIMKAYPGHPKDWGNLVPKDYFHVEKC